MNRLQMVMEAVDKVLENIKDAEMRRCGWIHLYGVSQACGLIALKRKEDPELAAVAGMLHDIHTYTTLNPSDHAHKGADLARRMMEEMKCFEPEEIDKVCGAIYEHSSKAVVGRSFDEVLKDADVFEHCLYHPLAEPAKKEAARFERLKREFGII